MQSDYALSMRVVFYTMAGVMAVAFVVALIGMPAGRVEVVPGDDEMPEKQDSVSGGRPDGVRDRT